MPQDRLDEESPHTTVVEFVCANQHIDGVEYVLKSTGAFAIQTKDASAQHDKPIIDGSWQQCKISAWFPSSVDTDAIQRILIRFSCRDFHARTLSASSWGQTTQENIQLVDIGPFRIGHEDGFDANDLIPISIGHGLAFGTGEHPTTRQCLLWLSRHNLLDTKVLDLGCGTGILAIATKKLGAHKVVAVDNDPMAIQITRSNAKRNETDLHVATKVDCRNRFDVVVANILANTLIQLAGTIETVLRPGGVLALSGILEEQIENIQAAFSCTTFQPAEREDGWVLLTGRKKELVTAKRK